jgi:hypothetical protein
MRDDIFASRTFELGPLLDGGRFGPEVVARSHLFMLPEKVPDVFLTFGQDLLFKGLFQLPFDKVFYEFYAKDYFEDTEDCERISLLCLKERVDRIQDKYRLQLSEFSECVGLFQYIRLNDKSWQQYSDPIIFGIGKTCSECHIARFPHDEERAGFVVPWCLAMTGMLNYSALIDKKIIIPTKIHRARWGKPPLYDFHIVRLEHIDSIRRPPIGTHAPPALHWRRGHFRRLASKIIPVSPCLVGDARYGIVEKAYDATRLEEVP